MKTITNLFSVIFLATLFINQANAQVKSDYDHTLDFSKFKTYQILGWVKDSEKEISPFNQKRIIEAIEDQFSQRGMTQDTVNADVAVTLYIVLKNETSTTAYTTFNGGMGYGVGRFGGWGMGAGMGSATTTYSNDDYQEGTSVIDIYDNSTKKLAWQGILTNVVKTKTKQQEKSIPKNVAKLMAGYPVKPIKQ
jgi:hypothetical protein